MKKIRLFAVLMLVMALVLTGCGEKKEEPKDDPTPQQQDTGGQGGEPSQGQDTQPSQPSEPTQPSEPSQPSTPTSSYQDSLSNKIPFSIDMGPGWEFRDVNVNGVHRRITITFEMESSAIDVNPVMSYYKCEVLGEGMYSELVEVGRAYLGDYLTECAREYKAADELDLFQFEMFEWDFKASSFKGKDKDYIVFSIPASWEYNTSSMIIVTAEGKLLGEFIADKSSEVVLQGDEDGEYKDYYGNTNFFKFTEDSITYLKVSQRVDGVTYLKEYALTIDNDQFTETETGKTYQTTDTVPDQPNFTIFA